MSESYKDNTELELTENDKESFDKELVCLMKHKFFIISKDRDLGNVIIKDYKNNMDLVPYIKYRPYQGKCVEQGYPCNLCNKKCNTWGTCDFKIS
jgi:hypothetical protein